MVTVAVYIHRCAYPGCCGQADAHDLVTTNHSAKNWLLIFLKANNIMSRLSLMVKRARLEEQGPL